MKKLFLPLLMTSALHATTVVWTTTGTVTSVTGNYQASVPVDTPVSVEMRYDDQAGRDVPRDLSGLGIPIKDLDFRDAINLSITVTIDGQIWKGEVTTGNSGSPYTLFLRLNGTEGGAESLTATNQESDGATFISFPGEIAAENNIIQLVFDSTDNTFLTDEITASSFKPEVITSSSGFLESGATNKISFSIDPLTVTIENASLIPPTPVLVLDQTGDNLDISWQSVFDVDYQLQSSLTMEEGSWNNTGSKRFGNGGTLTQNVAIIPGFNLYYRVVATAAPEL